MLRLLLMTMLPCSAPLLMDLTSWRCSYFEAPSLPHTEGRDDSMLEADESGLEEKSRTIEEDKASSLTTSAEMAMKMSFINWDPHLSLLHQTFISDSRRLISASAISSESAYTLIQFHQNYVDKWQVFLHNFMAAYRRLF
ncbi:hypothetical protein M5K25_004441 [Dendrobium thyrsiflorum]|uniref:Uncharacterized protein n=1 Tax=Dendrobium thyrsiflorum TaxID=117978 RepID=A0ABD0VLX7_DENTH